MNGQDLYELLRTMRYDLTALQAKVTSAFAILAELEIADTPEARCPVCGIARRGPRSLAEHLYTSHDGPEPAHWLEADALTESEDTAGTDPP